MNPDPEIVTVTPKGAALVGDTLVMFGPVTVRLMAFDHVPYCCTCAVPLTELAATVAEICVLLHEVTVA